MIRVEALLLLVTAFLLPSNLSYHFLVETAVINGIVVDYLIPKLYLSDLMILALISLNLPHLIRSLPSAPKKHLSFASVMLAILLIRSIVSSYPIAGIFSWLKLTEIILFGYVFYLRFDRWLKPLISGLLVAVFFQTGLGLYQFFFQQSLIGYLLFGEPQLALTRQIAKSTVFDAVRLLPYGTTPHPNVLAGFVSVSAIILFIFLPKITKKWINTITYLILLCLTTLVVFMTESLTALFGWMFSLAIFIRRTFASITLKSSILPHKYISSLMFILISMVLIYHSDGFFDNSSIIRRYKLFNTSTHLFFESPFSGWGLNQYIPTSAVNGLIADPAPFYQPVHSIYMLLLVEAGVPGLISLLLLLNLLRKDLLRRGALVYAFPLLALLLIGLFDHYPYTLQTGQLLFIISFIIYLKKR